MPSAVAFSWIARTAFRIESTDVLGNVFWSSRTKNECGVRLVHEAEQREREEQQRHEREQREVGDHRGEVRSAVGEELRSDRAHVDASMLGAMDADQAIADLTEISPQVKEVVVSAADGSVVGANVADRARRGSPRRRKLLEHAGRATSLQLEAATADGQRLRRPRRRSRDRGDDDVRADGRARLLRPEDLPPLDRRAEAACAPGATRKKRGRRCRGVSSSPA